MAEYEIPGVKKVRLRDADGVQLLPETSADIVLNLPEAVTEIITGWVQENTESVHYSVVTSEPEDTDVVLSTHDSVITGIDIDKNGHVTGVRTSMLPSMPTGLTVIPDTDGVKLTLIGTASTVDIKGTNGVQVTYDDESILISHNVDLSDTVKLTQIGPGLEVTEDTEGNTVVQTKLAHNNNLKGWLEYDDTGALRPGLLYEEV